MDNGRVSDLLRQGEGDQVEFKRGVPPPHVIARVLAAFGNTNGGVLLLGVEDDGTASGVSYDGAKAMVGRALGLIEPTPLISIEAADVDGKSTIAAVSIDPSPTPLFVEGDLFRRTGALIVAGRSGRLPSLTKGAREAARTLSRAAMESGERWIVREQRDDLGIDLEVELLSPAGERTGRLFKAVVSEAQLPWSLDARTATLGVDGKLLKYLRILDIPTIFFAADKSTGDIYWCDTREVAGGRPDTLVVRADRLLNESLDDLERYIQQWRTNVDGLTLFLSTRLLPWDQTMLHAFACSIVGIDTDIRVSEYTETSDGCRVRLTGSNSEDLLRIAEGLAAVTWRAVERNAIQAAGLLDVSAVKASLDFLREHLEKQEFWAEKSGAREMLEDQAEKHIREKDAALVRTWDQNILRGLWKTATKTVADEVLDGIADGVKQLVSREDG